MEAIDVEAGTDPQQVKSLTWFLLQQEVVPIDQLIPDCTFSKVRKLLQRTTNIPLGSVDKVLDIPSLRNFGIRLTVHYVASDPICSFQVPINQNAIFHVASKKFSTPQCQSKADFPFLL